jgi:uncharacterized 2Fe-2S/4Fe-4S cluster protein (DUF4445 family)
MSEANAARKVIFMPSGLRGSFPVGTSILHAARSLGVDLDSVCGGRGICTRCQVEVQDGEFPKHGIRSAPDHVSPASAVEKRLLERGRLGGQRRLSCQALLQEDVVIDVPAGSQVHRQVVRKAADPLAIDLDPVIRLCFVEVTPPALDAPSGDAERLLAALTEQWRIVAPRLASHLLPKLQETLRSGNWQVTCAVRDGQEVVALWPGFHERLAGVAIDVGSTTLAAHLCDLGSGELLASAGAMNPQIRFGEDLMSRVSYGMLNAGGAGEMTAAVRKALADLIQALAKQAGWSRDTILEVTLVGNPIMHHLLLGIDPVELGGAPFALAVDSALSVPAQDLALGLSPGARAYVLPCIAGHVGADAVAVALAEAPDERDEISLLVDVGTNAEIILGNRGRLYAASSPTGPAFEGAQISCGQRAAPGAIERVRIDRETFEPRYRLIGSEHWSDEVPAGVAAPRATGVCGSGIIEAIAELFLSGLIGSDGEFDPALQARTSRLEADGRTYRYRLTDGEQPLYITQADVRSIQLAKAALYAGIKLLLERAGLERVDRIRLAGAFGAHIDVTYAMVLGLIPDCDLDNVSAAGNAAGTGARMALLNAGCRRKAETLARSISKMETATEPRFQEHFVDAMAFPNKVDPFPRLRARVALPAATARRDRPSRRRRSP